MSRYKNLIDGDWIEECHGLWEILTGVILDIRTPLERLYKVVCNLKQQDLLDFRKLGKHSEEKISEILKESGYIWYNQKAKCFKQDIDFDLENASFEDIKSIYGIGDKLASMWMAIVHKSNEHPILDTHVLQFLRTKGYNQKDYKSLSDAFKKEADLLGLGVLELDQQILYNGIKNRLGK